MQTASTIKCPNCGEIIDINKTLFKEIEQEAIKKIKDQEKRLYQKEQELEAKVQKELQKELQKEKLKLQEELNLKLQGEYKTQIELLQNELNQKSKEIQELNKAKIQIEQLKREKEEIKLNANLKAEQRINQILAVEKEKIQKMLMQENELKLKEKEEQLNQLKNQLKEATRKAESTSQQLQGEAQELVIQEWLKQNFLLDEIQEIKKGSKGADCSQIINTYESKNCGTIYYESKRTKEFKQEWIEKFKSDILEKNADIGVLVTQTLPKNTTHMGLINGIWVCTFDEFKILSKILGEHIIELFNALKSQENKTNKMGVLYNYLTSNEFKLHIETIVDSFVKMQEDLESEKRAMNRLWKQREKQLQRVIDSTTSLYGSIKGIAGNAIANVKLLEL